MTFSPKSTRRILNMDTVRFPILSKQEIYNGCDLIMDSGADTCCAGKHAWVSAFIQGISVSCRGFSDDLPTKEDLPLANVVYAYDCPFRGEVILLHINYCIYMGNKKNDALACPNQLRSYGIEVDERPSSFFPNETNVQHIIADGVYLPLKMKGPLAFLSVRRPTINEINDDTIHHITLTSPHGWDPYDTDSFANTRTSDAMCNISFALSHTFHNMLQPCVSKKKKAITPEDLVL